VNSGYVFWCTPCGKDHSGECPPKKKWPPGYVIEPRAGKYPSTGTTWRKQVQLGGDWLDGLLWKVIAFDGAVSMSVSIVQADPEQYRLDPSVQTYSVEAWDPEGVVAPLNDRARVRFVREDLP